MKKKLQNTEDESVLKNNTEEINVTGEDIRNAKILWIKDVQTVMMTDKRFNNWKLQLGLFIDDENLWRCGGKLKNSDLCYDTKYPYLIPTEHDFTRFNYIELTYRG